MTARTEFINMFNQLMADVNEIAEMKGWGGNRNNGEMIALMHSELSEALEWMRNDNLQSDHIPEFLGVEEEFADVIIRIMHFGKMKNYRIAEALLAKIEFNATREYKHGGKKF